MHTLKKTTIVSAALISLLLSGCGGSSDIGGGSGNTSANSSNLSSSSVSSGAIDTTSPEKIGFGSGSSFVEGTIGVGNGNLSPGGTTNLTINIVSSTDTLVTTPVEVIFNSRCYAAEEATLSAGGTSTNKVTTEIGQATISYKAAGCVGDDEITATAIIDEVAKSARITINVAQDTVQSISFVDATPDKIFLKDSGGAQTSTVRFLVKGTTGSPLKNIPLDFTLSTQLGGIALTESTTTTDTSGHATTVVQAGTIPTAVEVIATDAESGVTARSNKLSIGTGMPDQNSFSIAADRFNPPGWEYDGEEVNLTVRLADAFNNPPVDGTSVQFITEGGAIDPNCTTINGSCSVKWKSQEPRPSNGRVTIYAYTVGNESFEDADGDGLYTQGVDIFSSTTDGGNCEPNVPLQTASATPDGNDAPCDDLGEAYLDKNEDGQYQLGEDYRDFNVNGVRNPENGIYNGVLCITEGTGCTKSPVHIRQDIVLSMSSEQPLTQEGRLLGQPESIEMGANETARFTVTLADKNGNAMPVGTTVSLSTSTASDVTINQSMTGGVANTLNPTSFSVTLKASETKRPTGSFNIVVTSPKGTAYSFSTSLIPKPTENTAALYIGKGTGQTFQAGKIEVGIGDALLQPNGSTSLSVNFVDDSGQLTTGTAQATFSSDCVDAGTALLTDANGQPASTVSTQTGRATIIYTDNGCTGTDLVTATSPLAGLEVHTATATLTIQEITSTAQNIVFNAATPAQISLKGVGGIEISEVSFIVNDSNGLPLTNVPVMLKLNNSIGGVCLTGANNTCIQEISATSNANGIVTAYVQAGTVPTTVRVTASTEANDVTISTQSSGLVISTGIPDQDSMSLSASQYNPPNYVDGFEVDVVIRMADAFNNPVPEDTSVIFTASGGSIDGSCSTNASGSCTVTWRSQSPRPASGKVTILATALGNESFIDTNGNGTYDISDTFSKGGASCELNAPPSTLANPVTACDDLGEAYLDSNQNDAYDLGEVFVDIFGPSNSLTQDGVRTSANDVYDGALCPAGASSSTCTRNSVTVRENLTLVLGGREADTTGDRLIGQPANVAIAANTIEPFTVILQDSNGNSLPAGTTVTVISTDLDGATISLSPTPISVGTNMTGPTTFEVSVKRDATPASGQFQLVVTTPGGTTRAYTTTVTSL